MFRALFALSVFSMLLICDGCNPVSPKSSASSYLLKGTVSDGSGAISCAATSTVTDAGNGTFYVSFSCIETSNPMRQISISTPGFVTGNPEGTTVTLSPTSVFAASYGNVQKAGSFTVWSTDAAGGSGTITFSKCPVGSNTVVATFNLTLVHPGQSDVTITNGTVGQ
jgi:hypothetical protein